MARKVIGGAIVGLGVLCAGNAAAGPRISLQPVQGDGQAVRFDRGQYIVDYPGRHAAVQIRSVVVRGDDVAFEVGVVNLGAAPINIDVGDIQVDGPGQPVHVLTRGELEHKAETHARWAKIWTTLGSSLAASAFAGQRNYYHATTTTSYGTYHTTVSAPCIDCRFAAAGMLVAGGARLAQIQARLDETRAELGEHAFQLTTIPSGQIYGGRVSLTRFKHESGGIVRLTVNVDGEPFAFAFRFTPEGTPTPVYRSLVTTASPAAINAIYVPSPPPPTTEFVQPSPPVRPAIAVVAPVASATSGMAVRHASVSTAAGEDWRRYYAALVENGVTKGQAKDMADQQFGPIG